MSERIYAMTDRDWLAARFEENREHLRAVAYSMLGSVTDADDAVQEAWLRLDRSTSDQPASLQAWLTTVVARISLDVLRRRQTRREQYVGTWLPEPVVTADDGPEGEALLADSVGIALLIVLEELTPSERLAFVLHDVFGVPFDEIATTLGRSTEAARQLATRARRRVRSAPVPDRDLNRQREVVAAFLAAARSGDMQGLLDVLHPDVVFRSDIGADRTVDPAPVIGAQRVAERVLRSAPAYIHFATPALVNGNAGAVFGGQGRRVGVVGFTVVNGRIASLDLIADPQKLRHITVAN
jgi:RNA polymerase sigma factor (sigma-70 family)